MEKYKNYKSPISKNGEYLDDINLLVIDMSLKNVQRTIEQMDKFNSVKILVITGGAFGSFVNLDDILTRARNYPLEELYIMNFRNFVTKIPKQISHFKSLTTLSIINNNVISLPKEIGLITSLKVLYVDVNPISTLLPIVSNLKQLEKLGISKTRISQSEIVELKQQLPYCEILLQ